MKRTEELKKEIETEALQVEPKLFKWIYDKGKEQTNSKWKQALQKLKEKIRSSLNFTPAVLERDNQILMIVDKIFGELI